MKYKLEIVRQIYTDPSDPDACSHRKVASIKFDSLQKAIDFGMNLAKSMANPKNEQDVYFLNRGFEETLPGGKAYEVGFHDYSMSITPSK